MLLEDKSILSKSWGVSCASFRKAKFQNVFHLILNIITLDISLKL